ncbi:helix-turn-helix transcriptional regulator [Paraburkholderia youngii]|uniref:helix-turn-helix transcriptional regulator n=1 Tax=Paraburkholderia youngii TaxID=2782701 RepID=UPI003D24B3B1
MAQLADVHAAIQHIYDAVLSPQRWDDALAYIVALTGSDGGYFLSTQEGAPVLSISTALAEQHALALQRELQTRLPAWMERIPVGVARRQSSEISDSDFRRTAIYTEAVGAERLFYGLIAPIVRSPDRQAYLTVGRRLDAVDHEETDESAAALLAPHLCAALAIRSRLAAADLREQCALDVLMRLEIGVVLLDECARPLFVNASAERLSSVHDGLVINHREVTSLVAEDAKKLHSIVSSALQFGSVQKAADLHLFRAARCYIRRRGRRLPLIIRMAPVPARDTREGLGALVRVSLFVLEPDRAVEVDGSVVAETFCLSPREAEPAALLARGENIAQAAHKMNIGLETARAYLKVIQAKTQTHRQAELVALLLQSGMHVLR